jgi:serine/threonine protein kinase
VKWLSDRALDHLRKVADLPDLSESRYELVEKIGQGGMGAVYLVRDRELDRHVALKVLDTSCLDAQAGQRMAREARILARLEHPGIVPIHDSGVLPDGRFYYVMKLVRGKRLDQHVTPAMTMSERLAILARICDTLAFAHAHGVIHRDLKPQNVMIGAFGEVLILDWGVAKEVSRRPESSTDDTNSIGPMPASCQPPLENELSADYPGQLSQAGTVVGTQGYMAPEQARGETAEIDERADIYAVGGILYFLLTGRAPEHDGPLDQATTGDIPAVLSPRQLDRNIPRPLEAVCLKALAVHREKRYTTVAELSAEVADFVAGRRVRAYPEGFLESALRLGSKYRTVIALLLAYLLMRIGFMLFVPAR